MDGIRWRGGETVLLYDMCSMYGHGTKARNDNSRCGCVRSSRLRAIEGAFTALGRWREGAMEADTGEGGSLCGSAVHEAMWPTQA